MLVRCNRWYNESTGFRPFTGRKLFCFVTMLLIVFRDGGKVMYQKVDTDLKFVDREKEVEKFWDDHEIFQKSMDEKEGCRNIPFMMDLRQQTENRISVMC